MADEKHDPWLEENINQRREKDPSSNNETPINRSEVLCFNQRTDSLPTIDGIPPWFKQPRNCILHANGMNAE